MSIALITRRAFHAAGLAAALAACHEEKAPSPPAVVVAQPVHAEAGAAFAPLRFPTEAAPRYSNPMSFRVAGKLIERKVRIGDAVRKGEIVARLDAADAEEQKEAAKAALAAAEHRLLFAKLQLDRDTAQSARNLIAASQLEQSQDAFAAARSARDEAAAQLALAQDRLNYHDLVADHDGVITTENADTGQVLAAGQPVYGLAWSGDIDALLDVGAQDVGRIKVGQKAQARFMALGGRIFAGTVREISPAADPQSRTYRVRLSLIEPNAALRLGMTGEVTLTPDDGNGAPAFRLPATAIFHSGDNPAIFVVRPDDMLELRKVTVLDHGFNSAAVSGDLKEGERVVLAGVHAVYEGEKVKAVRPLFDEEGDIVVPDQHQPGDKQ